MNIHAICAILIYMLGWFCCTVIIHMKHKREFPTLHEDAVFPAMFSILWPLFAAYAVLSFPFYCMGKLVTYLCKDFTYDKK